MAGRVKLGMAVEDSDISIAPLLCPRGRKSAWNPEQFLEGWSQIHLEISRRVWGNLGGVEVSNGIFREYS